ncbi:MAG: cupin domain-containing protein [Kosmotogaceae bacterium]
MESSRFINFKGGVKVRKLVLNELPVYRADPPNERDNLVLVDRETGAENMSVGIGIYSKGQASEFHTHENEEEVMIYLKGKGVMKTSDGKVVEISKGDVTYVPKNESHKLTNTGDEDFVFLFIYSPMGPEKNIRTWDIVRELKYSFEDLG